MEQPSVPYRGDIPVEVRRKSYRALLKDYVLHTFFEQYWKDLFFPEDPHEKEIADPKDPHKVYTHVFKPCTVPADGKKVKKEYLSTLCVVPITRYHWDVILFAFHLFFPDIYRCPADVALYLIDGLERLKMKPNKIMNFDNHIYTFLQKHSQGEELKNGRENWMIVDPVHCIYSIAKAEVLLRLKFKGTEREDELPKDMVEKLGEMKAAVQRSVDHFFNR